MPGRRIKTALVLLFLCHGILAARLYYLQYRHARSLTVIACRQRLVYRAALGWDRADLCDRRGRPLIDAPRATPALAGLSAADAERMARYQRKPLAVHLIGYVNPGDGRGAAGIEAACDQLLAAGSGRALASIVDGLGQPVAGLGLRLLRRPGRTPLGIRLAIDRGIQARVEAIADRELAKGAVVVMAPATGEILAMASRPAFDPTNPARDLGDPNAPFINRALRAYPPGSLFKLVVAAAALEEDPAHFYRIYHDPGHINLGPLRFRCPGAGHGEVTLADALAFSCNTVFIRLALELGPEKIAAMAERLGLGAPALEDLAGEDLGILPPRYGLTPGDMANLALGQREIMATPIQMARLMSAVANNGLLPRARVILGRVEADGRLDQGPGPEQPARVLAPRTAKLLRIMLEGAARYGTGREAWSQPGVGGKTGTAQTGKTGGSGEPLNHAWFAGYAPADRPRYVVAVLAEEGGSGGAVAAPIFRQIVESLYDWEDPGRDRRSGDGQGGFISDLDWH